ncbi:MAG: hypothetical protein AAGF07_04230 [Patescibacteria group bacterium]
MNLLKVALPWSSQKVFSTGNFASKISDELDEIDKIFLPKITYILRP